MKPLKIVFLTLVHTTAFAQLAEYKLCITNKTDQIYAIIDQGLVDSLRALQKNDSEAYADFIFHSKKLGEKVSIPVKIYISSSVTFEKEKVDIKIKSPFTYLFIKKGDKRAKILKGVDTWASLKEQVEKYFNTGKSQIGEETKKNNE